MDHATKEVHEQPQEAPGDDVVSVVEGFPGGPYDTLVLMDYAYHVTVTVWNKEVLTFKKKNIYFIMY